MAIDLTSTSFNIFQDQIDFGQTLKVEFTVKNNGDMDADPFSLDLILSPSPSLDGSDDYKLGTYDIVTGLKAGEEVTKTYKYPTPDADNPVWVSGPDFYFVGSIIDPDNEIAESDEENNKTSGFAEDFGIFHDSYEVVDFGPSDLAATSLTVDGSGFTPGAKVPVSFTIENLSTTESAHPFSIDIYLTANDTFNPATDFKLGTYDIRDVLAPGADTGVKSYKYTLPGIDNDVWAGNGTHHIHLDIDPDNEVAETNDDNNSGEGLGIDSFEFDVTGIDEAPNLKVSSFSAPDSFAAGDTISVDYEITNDGGSDANNFATGFYLTTTDYLSSGLPVGVDDVPGILLLQGNDRASSLNNVKAGESTGSISTEITIPEEWGGFSGAGEYVIGAIADVFDDVAENNETDNSNFAQDVDYKTVTVDAPDNTGAVDLEGSFFEVGTVVKAGDGIDVSFKVANKDVGNVDPFDVDLYLSQDENISADEDFYLGTYTIPEGIAGNAETDLKSFTYQGPAADDPFFANSSGSFYAGMIIDPDGDITEIDETNNSNVEEGKDFAKVPTIADLTINSFEVVGTPAFNKGDTVEVKYEIMNDGTGAANNFAAGFFLFDDEYQANNEQLSLDDVPEVFFIQADDRASNLISLEAGESTGMVTTQITLPTEWVGFDGGATDFNLGVAADPFDDVTESNELNNSFNSVNTNFADISIF